MEVWPDAMRLFCCGHPWQKREPIMSSPPQGRALTFPIVWGRDRGLSPTAPETTDPKPSDEQLMALVRENNSEALEGLFNRYSRLVLSIARRIVHDAGEAEEVVQEVFFYLYKKSRLFDACKGSVKSWIVQLASHRALDRRSHLKRRGFYLGTEIGSLDDILLGETDLDREIESKLNRVQLEKAFEQLPAIQRRTLELFYFEGLELREISARLNEPLGNSRHHLYRGLERMRKSAFVQRLRETKP
jgi:RNA polymerase sigma-70 factor (ECF subfamily)